jgi:hypothetical protein
MFSQGSDSAPSEARKRGSGGESPRMHDDLLTALSELDAQPRHLRSCAGDSTPSEARKRGLFGEDPPRSSMSYVTNRSYGPHY